MENEDEQRKYKTRKNIIQFGPVEFEVPVGYSKFDLELRRKSSMITTEWEQLRWLVKGQTQWKQSPQRKQLLER